MLFLGVLSVLQLILIPGLLLIRLFPSKRSAIQQAVYIFMLSLLANYAAVFLLVAVGLYMRSVMLVLFAGEVALLAWLSRDHWTQKFGGGWSKLEKGFAKTLRDWADWMAKDFWGASLYLLFGLAALIGMGWVLSVWVNHFGTVFQAWDAWASWDRWAEAWAINRFPGDTWEYPQLIPVTYSISYKFIGTVAVKFFGKSIMPLFTLVIMLMLFDLGRVKKSFGYMLGSALALYSIYLFLAKYIPEGYVDIPVACFSLMSVYSLLKARDIRDPKQLKETLLLGSLATAAAAVTKQTGLFLMAFYPIFAYLWVLKDHKRFKTREALVLLAKQFLLVLAIAAPWYAYMEYRILFGGNVSNIQYVINDIYNGMTLPQRFVAAVQGLGNYAYLFAFLIASLLVVSTPFRHLIILVILPFSVLWALFLSYEHRNLAVVFPLLSMTVGVAAEAWVTRVRAAVKKPRPVRLPAYALLLIAVLVAGLATVAINAEELTALQIKGERNIFEPTLNDKLYRYFSREEGPEPVITNYPIGWLPEMEDLWRNDRFKDYQVYKANLIAYSDSTLLLIRLDANVDPKISAEVQGYLADGTYQMIFTDSGYMLIRIPPRK